MTDATVSEKAREAAKDVINAHVRECFRLSGFKGMPVILHPGIAADALIDRVRRETIEQCAKVAERFGRPVGAGDGDTMYILGNPATIATAIRAILDGEAG